MGEKSLGDQLPSLPRLNALSIGIARVLFSLAARMPRSPAREGSSEHWGSVCSWQQIGLAMIGDVAGKSSSLAQRKEEQWYANPWV